MAGGHGPTDLLLDCLSFRADPVLSRRVAGISLKDWDEIVAVAVHRGLGPLLFRRLKAAGAPKS